MATLCFETNAILKVDLGCQGGTRRITFAKLWDPTNSRVSFQRLSEMVCGYSNLSDSNIHCVTVTYTDEEGDIVTLSTDDELTDAFEQFSTRIPPIVRATASFETKNDSKNTVKGSKQDMSEIKEMAKKGKVNSDQTLDALQSFVKILNQSVDELSKNVEGTQLIQRELKKKCLGILKILQLHDHFWVFSAPVDPVKLMLPDYFNIVAKPMDLGTVQKKVDLGQYHSVEEFHADVCLTFDNAMLYNEAGSVVHGMAIEVKTKFIEEYDLVINKLKVDQMQGVLQSFVKILTHAVGKKSCCSKDSLNGARARKACYSEIKGKERTKYLTNDLLDEISSRMKLDDVGINTNKSSSSPFAGGGIAAAAARAAVNRQIRLVVAAAASNCKPKSSTLHAKTNAKKSSPSPFARGGIAAAATNYKKRVRFIAGAIASRAQDSNSLTDVEGMSVGKGGKNCGEDLESNRLLLIQNPEIIKYFKMLELGFPKESAQHALRRDGRDPSILEIDPKKYSKDQDQEIIDHAGHDNRLLKEDPEYKKYFKMLKLGLPVDAVKHAIKKDVKDESVMDLDKEKSFKSQLDSEYNEEEEEEDIGPPSKEDPEYKKYFKMLKLGLPVDAVKHAIKKDGKDESVMDLDKEKSFKSQLDSEYNEEEEEEDIGPPLKEDPEYKKYFKMLKMGLPVDAVKNALERDNKNPTIIDMDPERCLVRHTKTKTKNNYEEVKRPTVRRKRLFWDAMEKSKIKQNSLWGEIHDIVNVDKLFNDTPEFDALFIETYDSSQKNKTNTACRDSSAKKPKKIVKVIDGKRGMNGEIILARFKMNFTDLANTIDSMSCGKFDSVQLQALKKILPTDEEKEELKLYLSKATTYKSKEAAIADLCLCEKYMVAIMEVIDSSNKFDCMLFESQFQSRMEEITKSISTLNKACNDVKDSKRLRKLMAVTLSLGNKLNTGGTGHVAHGFTLNSLLKLNEAKAFDRKTSILQYLVKILRPYDKELLNFKEDIISSTKAENIILDTLSVDIKNLVEEIKIVKMISTVDGESRRGECEKYENFDVQKSLTELKERKMHVKEINGVKFYNQMELPMKYTPMEIFSQSADIQIQDARNQIYETQKKFADLLEYFGENNKMSCTEFFGTLNKFTSLFQLAIDDKTDHCSEVELKEGKHTASDIFNRSCGYIGAVEPDISMTNKFHLMNNVKHRAEPLSSYELPSGWVKVVDPLSGKPYYYNKVEHITMWDKPLPRVSLQRDKDEVAVNNMTKDVISLLQ